jgi:LuxR family transcriptional regulator, maltose regulon positive regulatory protein
MPKAAQYILLWSSEQHTYVLYEQDQGYQALLQGEEERWFGWLATHTSFSFQGKHGMPSRLLCNDVQREGIKPSTDLAS